MRNAERRRCSRFSFDGECVAEFSRVYREVTMRNISMYGALVEATNLAVHFDRPDCIVRAWCADGRILALPATVARSDHANLLAFSWTHLGGNARQDLRRLIWATLSVDQVRAFVPPPQTPPYTRTTSLAVPAGGGKSRFRGALVVWGAAPLERHPAPLNTPHTR